MEPKDSKKSKLKAKDTVSSQKLTALQSKQKEVARVVQLKSDILLKSGEVSYLEFLEIREEIERLNSLKQKFSRRAEKLKQQSK